MTAWLASRTGISTSTAARNMRSSTSATTATNSSRFADVGNPHLIGDIGPGQTVLDHACGAGMDLLLAARKVGPEGRALFEESD
ncbi:MAG: hypothetical protein IH874_03220 [Candidatus Dadabacteria bacterium]|nr:hypothetical protein [Candidatus Dadabacteria bacterium]